MFLRNFDNVMVLLAGANFNTTSTSSVSQSQGGTTISGTTVFDDNYINVKTTSGSIVTPYLWPGSYLQAPCRAVAQGICIGNGNTAVTYNDFKLSGDCLNSRFTLQAQSCTRSWVNGELTQNVTLTLYNNTDSTQTISEWGLWGAQPSGSTSSSSTYYWTSSTSVGYYSNSSSYAILYYREVLNTAVEVPSHGTAVVTFSVKYPMPNHP